MQEKLKEIRKNMLIEVNNSWGLGAAPGESGIIITNDKKIYHYHRYYRNTPILEENNIPLELISEGKLLIDGEYEKVITFIENEVVDKNFEYRTIFDASFNVVVNYNGNTFNIRNQKGDKENKLLYDKTQELVQSIKVK